MTFKVNPGALAGAAEAKKSYHAKAASDFSLFIEFCVGQPNDCGFVHFLVFSHNREVILCK